MALSTDDLVSVHQLYARYCHAIDDGDGGAFAACFTGDGALDAGTPEPIAGADALEGFASAVAANVPGIRHQATNIVIDGDGDEATGRAYLSVYRAAMPAPEVITIGRYVDTLRKVEGVWRFALRRYVPDTPASAHRAPPRARA